MSFARPLTILFATQTANTLTVADWIEQRAIDEGFEVELIDMVDCRAKDLESVETLLLAVSTQEVGGATL